MSSNAALAGTAEDAAEAALAELSAPSRLAAYPEIATYVGFVTPRVKEVALQRDALVRFRAHVASCIAQGAESSPGATRVSIPAFDAGDLARVDAELKAVQEEARLLAESITEQCRLSVDTIEALDGVMQERSAAVAALEDAENGALLSSRPGFAAYWTGTADRLEAALVALRSDAAASTSAVVEEVGKLRGAGKGAVNSTPPRA